MAERKKEEHPVVVALIVFFIGVIWAKMYGEHVLRTEPDPENYPGWVRALDERGLFPKVYSLAERNADDARDRERRQARLVAIETERARRERPQREPPVRAPSAEALAHPLGRTLTLAAQEADLAEVVVLGVECGEGRAGYCIGWGMGTAGNQDVHALMRTPSFREHRGSVAEWAVSAVHWGSDWEGEPAFFALGIHPRKDDTDLRKAFEVRSLNLRTAHEAAGDTGQPIAGDVSSTP